MRVHWFAFMLLLTLTGASARAEDPPTRLWVKAWNSPANHEDIGRLLAVDTPNRIYVGGSTYDPAALHDYLLLQYDAAGNLVWTRQYGETGDEMISDIRVPTAGEVVITGLSAGQNGHEVATAKYDNLGNLLWDRRFPVQNAFTDFGPKMSIDGNRNIVISATNGNDYILLKYAPDGTLLWSRIHDGPGHTSDIATDVATDPDGSIYVTGTGNNSTRFMTVKFSPSGDFVWEQLEAGDIGSVFAPSQVAVGPDHDVVVAGNPESTCGVFQFKIWKCAAASGAVLWSDTAPAPPCSSFVFQDLTLDVHGNALAACSGSDGGVDTHMQVLRYSPDGTRQWIRQFDGPGTADDEAAAIATDGVGAAYAFGYTNFPPQNRDYAAVKFTADGVQAWSATWASPQGTNDLGQDIIVDPAGDVIVTGNSFSSVTNEDVVTIKYHQASAAQVSDPVDAGADRLALGAAPNPTAHETAIHYKLAREGHVRLQILTPDGRLTRTLVDEVTSMGPHVIRWRGTDAQGARLPAGIYIVRLEAEGEASTAKVSLLP